MARVTTYPGEQRHGNSGADSSATSRQKGEEPWVCSDGLQVQRHICEHTRMKRSMFGLGPTQVRRLAYDAVEAL